MTSNMLNHPVWLIIIGALFWLITALSTGLWIAHWLTSPDEKPSDWMGRFVNPPGNERKK